MSLKPFNLERALAGDPVVYRDGTAASEIFYSANRLKSAYQPIISIDYDGSVRYHNLDGTFFADRRENSCDLFMAPKKVKYYYASWENTIEAGPGRFCTNMYTSEELLLNTHRMTGRKGKDHIIHEIEIEE